MHQDSWKSQLVDEEVAWQAKMAADELAWQAQMAADEATWQQKMDDEAAAWKRQQQQQQQQMATVTEYLSPRPTARSDASYRQQQAEYERWKANTSLSSPRDLDDQARNIYLEEQRLSPRLNTSCWEGEDVVWRRLAGEAQHEANQQQLKVLLDAGIQTSIGNRGSIASVVPRLQLDMMPGATSFEIQFVQKVYESPRDL